MRPAQAIPRRAALGIAVALLVAAVLLAAGLYLLLRLAAQDSAPPTITFAAALLPAEKIQYMQVLREFTGQTGIRVNLIGQQYEPIRTVVEAEAAAGRGRLDLVELDVFQLPLLQQAMQPLESLIGTEDDLAASIPGDAWTVGLSGEPRRLLYVPHRLNWQALVYDSEALPEPPADWDALLAAAREHPGRIGLKCARYEGLVCDVFPFLWQAGGNPLRPDSPQALRTMRYLQELSRYFNPAVRSYKEESIRQAMEYREIRTQFNWPFVVPIYRDKSLMPAPFKTAPLPAGPAGQATVLGGGYLGIPATAPHPRAAGRLVEYLTRSRTQAKLAAHLGWFPIRPEGWEGFAPADRELYAGYMAMQPHIRARPNVPHYPTVSDIWQEGFHAIVFGGADPAATLQQMQARIDAAAQQGAAR